MKNVLRSLFVLALFAIVFINPRNAAAFDGKLSGDSYLFWGQYNGDQKPFSNVDDQSGAFTYSYPLEIPAGRNGVQPSLELDYNSNALVDGSLVGFGWMLSIPSIERLNKHGLATLYSDTTFTTSLGGELQPDSIGSGGVGTYLPKVAGPGFLSFEYLSNGSWKATDSKGVVYLFGTSSDSQLVDPNDSTHIDRWYVDSITDKNGNKVTFTYSKDGNQVYPSNINYTGNGSEDGLFDVAFTLEDRDDDTLTYDAGFPVTTAKRISIIEAKVDDIVRKQFAFNYVSGTNGKRSVLHEVTATAYDEDHNATALPPLTMTNSGEPQQWQGVASAYALPTDATGGAGNLRYADVNGDGLVDVLSSFQTHSHTPNYAAKVVLLNNGIDWDENNTAWSDSMTVPFTNYDAETQGGNPSYDLCEQVIDVNGDGLPDLVYSNSTEWLDLNGNPYQAGVYMNTGFGWETSPSWTLPVDICNFDNDLGVRFADVNGDGLTDIIQSTEVSGGTEEKGVYLNTGSGWTEDTSWTVPITFTTYNGFDRGARVLDVNRDGLADIIQSLTKDADNNPDTIIDPTTYEEKHVYINNGGGWAEDTNWDIPAQPEDFTFARDYYSCTSCAPSDDKTRLADINGDGLVDIIDLDASPQAPNMRGAVAYNTGSSWVIDTSEFILPTDIFSGNCRYPDVTLDVNGDGMDDFLSFGGTACQYSNFEESYVSTGVEYDSGTPGEQYNFPADTVTNITSPSGATYAVRYKPAAHYKDASNDPANTNLPFPKMTMESLTIDDGFGNTSTTSYSYEGGSYYYNDADDRKFAGFSKITATDALGNVTIDYFHQGNDTNSSLGESADDVSKIGRKYREENYDDNGHLYRTTIDNWINASLGADSDFVYKGQTMELDYDADTDHKDKAITYTYDTANGNLTEEKNWGRVTGSDDGTFTDTGSDIQKTDYTYATWQTGGATTGFKAIEMLYSNGGTLAEEHHWKYDALTGDKVSLGNLTRTSKWVTGTTYAPTDYTYDSYGVMTSMTDPDSNTTTYDPDTNELYPATVTDAYANVTTYTYDYSSGKPTEVIDVNGHTFQTDYDGFGRKTEERQPDATTPSTFVVAKTYAYTDTFPASVHETDLFDGSSQKDVYTYFDGLGRPIQKREEAAGSSTYNVTDTTYDERGDIKSVSLPYSSSDSSRTTATTDADLLEVTSYDPLHRVTSVVNAAGTDSTSYEDWTATETDRDGKIKDYAYNALGRLVAVTEHKSSGTNVTTYIYNAAGSLIKVTDALDNIRNFTFDGAENRKSAEDLHVSGDTAFGTWNYTYDLAGNMLTSVSPNGVTTTYTYDDLNRVLTEDSSSTTGTDTTYVYDSCTNGVGKLCSATLLNGTVTAYTYDPLGRTATETKTISSTAYATSYLYNRQGVITSVTYPDTSITSYTFDNAGSIHSVTFDDGHTTGLTQTIASDITYGPHGKVTSVTYGNGVVSTWDYDATELYRLQNKTTVSGTTNLEDFTYDYDGVGNLSNLTDASDLYADMSIAYTYSDLHRLTNATSTSTDSVLAYNKSWTYNALNDILTFGSSANTYSYNGNTSGNYANPHAATTIGSATLTYDHNGNVLTNGTWTNTWDYKNELLSSANGTLTDTYVYDHAGNRVKQSDGTNTLIYPNSYYTIDGSNVERHILAGSLGSLATSTWDGTAATVVYHHDDHLGGTHVETDSTGAAIEYILYKPFGGTLVDHKTGTYDNNFKYTGKEKDEDTGWYYYGARYYNADTGQFLSEDPEFLAASGSLTDPQSLNAYAYARNNPVRNIDPDGRSWEDIANVGAGIANAMLTNMAGGLGRTESQDSNYNLGQGIGDAASMVQGIVEIAVGGGMDGGGLALSATGIGAIPGIPAVAAGALLVGHGAATATAGGANLLLSAPKPGSYGGPGAGMRFPESVKDTARAESNNTCVFCGQETSRTPGPTQSNIDHAVSKAQGGNNTIENAQNTCRTCNLQKGASTTQQFMQKITNFFK